MKLPGVRYLPNEQDMLSGAFRVVKDQIINMKHPWNSSIMIRCKFTGETLNGLAHGMGEFIWDDDGHKCSIGWGLFEQGQLNG